MKGIFAKRRAIFFFNGGDSGGLESAHVDLSKKSATWQNCQPAESPGSELYHESKFSISLGQRAGPSVSFLRLFINLPGHRHRLAVSK
jgi:hypothetical protein